MTSAHSHEHAHPVLVEVTRGPLVESRHRASYVVIDSDGHVVQKAGDGHGCSATSPAASTRSPTYGEPPWPCCFHVRLHSNKGDFPSPAAVSGVLKLAGSDCPASLFSSGL